MSLQAVRDASMAGLHIGAKLRRIILAGRYQFIPLGLYFLLHLGACGFALSRQVCLVRLEALSNCAAPLLDALTELLDVSFASRLEVLCSCLR